MKKSIPPPENWQDFESLCKKLFGEMWQCPLTIKKNGRLGQLQFGVDVYGKPKGENEYWGIQCKGKNNYIKSKLTSKEIDEEVEKASNFKPNLKTLIFATTAPKDAVIEEYIRLKDEENCRNESFEIHLYSWEDIVDLIEEHRNTFNWYMNNIQFKDKFDIEVKVDTAQENNILVPTFKKITHSFELHSHSNSMGRYATISVNSNDIFGPSAQFFGKSKINHSFCEIKISIINTGEITLENWKVWIDFENSIQKVGDNFTTDPFLFKEASKYRTTWAFQEGKRILYEPLNNDPLVQKDQRTFYCYCIPPFESNEISFTWKLLAKDFNREGEIKLKVVPQYIKKRKTTYIKNENEIRLESKYEEHITDN
jgi:hypothetical protein